MQDEWREKGLVVVGVHVKPSVMDDALALCRRLEINFPNYNTGYVDFKGVDGTPTVFFFDAAGDLVHKGFFAGHEKELEALLEKAPDWVTGPRDYVHVGAEAQKIRNRSALGSASHSLRVKAVSDNPAEKEEASFLLERLEKYAESLGKRARAKAACGYPRKSLDLWKGIARDFKGDRIGDEASRTEKGLSDDPSFQRELDALKRFRMLEKLASRLKARFRGQPVENWRKKNKVLLHQLRAAHIALAKKYGDTKVCARAGEFLNRLGVN